MEELPPVVRKQFNVVTFSLHPLGWLNRILGSNVVEEHYKRFYLISENDQSNDALLNYLNATFNPMLNQKLKRPWDYPTFRDMLEHAYTENVIKDSSLSDQEKDEFIKRQLKKKIIR